MDDHQRQNQNSTESQTFKLPLRISQHISLDKFNQQTTTVNDDEPQNPNATGSQKGDDDDSRKPPADWVYRDGWITVSYPFLRSLLHLHKHSLEKRQIKRWDYLVDAEWAYTKIWNKRALLYNERMDLKLYKKAMLVKQRDAMKNKIHEKPEMLERLKDSVNAQKRTDRQIQDVNKRIRQAEKAVHQSAVELSYMTKCFIERDLPILADMTDELIKEQAKQGRWDHKVGFSKSSLITAICYAFS